MGVKLPANAVSFERLINIDPIRSTINNGTQPAFHYRVLFTCWNALKMAIAPKEIPSVMNRLDFLVLLCEDKRTDKIVRPMADMTKRGILLENRQLKKELTEESGD